MVTNAHSRTGLAYGVGAYALWGILPLYLHVLRDVPPAQVLSHRVLWSLLLLAAVIIATRRLQPLLTAARGRVVVMLAASAVLIAINWFVYIWSVANAHLVEASLGYFINPLVNVALGTALLGERLGRLQGAAIGIAALGVALLALNGGGAIWISITLALTFGFYGLIRKVVPIDALGGLTIETGILAPLAVALLLYASSTGTSAFGSGGGMDLLLVLAGPITAAPLLLFAAGAKRLRYTTMGLLQFIAPTLQFLEAVLLFHEPVRAAQLTTFGLIWIGCGLYAWSSVAAARRPAA